MRPFVTLRRKADRDAATACLLLSAGVLFLLAMHYYNMHPGGFGLWLPFNITTWIPVSWIIGLGLIQAARQGEFRYSRLSLWLGACCLLLLATGWLPGSKPVLENGVLYGVLAGFLFLMALQQFPLGRPHRAILFGLVLAAAWIQAGWGWGQCLGVQGFPPEFGEIGARPTGVFFQPNVMASFLVTGLLLSAYLLVQLDQLKLPARITWIIRTFLLASPLLLTPLVVLLNSRTGWVGLSVGVALMQPLLWRHLRPRLAATWCCSVLAGLLLALTLIAATDSAGAALGKMNLETPRTNIYPQVMAMIRERPLAGYGHGSFESAYTRYTAEQYAAGNFDSPGLNNLTHPHNELLYWWAEAGIVGLLALLLAALVVLRRIWQCRDKTLALALMALFFPITLHTQTELPFYSSVAHWIIFILLIYLADASAGALRQRPLPFTASLKIFGVVVPAAGTLFMASTLQSANLLSRYEVDPRMETAELNNLWNPMVWLDRLDRDLAIGQMILGIYENRPAQVLTYIDWASKRIETQPRPVYYQYLIISHRYLGNTEVARQIEEEARFLFPEYGFDFTVPGIEQLKRRIPEGFDARAIPEQPAGTPTEE